MSITFHSFSGYASFDVYMFNVGQGECILFKDNYCSLLLDCGNKNNPGKYSHVPLFIENAICTCRTDLVISHYHEDHYNIFGYFQNPQNYICRLFVPKLPIKKARHVGEAIFSYLAASIYINYNSYRILPRFFSRLNKIAYALEAGNKIDVLNQTMKVLWPNFSDSIFDSEIIYEKSQKIVKQLRPLLMKHDINIHNYVNEGNNAINIISALRNIANRGGKDENITSSLNDLEEEFRFLNNLISLVLISYKKIYDRILLLGDAPKRAIDTFNINNQTNYCYVKASHHGTEYGASLDHIKNDYLLISRSVKEYRKLKEINKNYYLKMNNKKILNTEDLGSVIITRK